MSTSAVFVMDIKGRIIISRDYRGDIPMNISEKFTRHLSIDDEDSLTPIITDGSHWGFLLVHSWFQVHTLSFTSDTTISTSWPWQRRMPTAWSSSAFFIVWWMFSRNISMNLRSLPLPICLTHRTTLIGRKYSGQLCDHLWVDGWDDGLWISPVHGSQDPEGLHLRQRETRTCTSWLLFLALTMSL